jgi:UDP-N-acetylglucosamine--N-acetylmuramyl-(pentapeptide) pyrophosphoryl-undecaprenol N-acetylglucosamine transferase
VKGYKKNRIIVSGGGTGGHIFPALSIANALMAIDPELDILFVGAQGRMEMEKVPAAGFRIVGLPIMGFQRKLTVQNLVVVYKLLISLIKARKLIRNFKPSVVVGVGGYASGPILRTANNMGIPTLIQEQNSYAGVTNKLLAQKAQKICVAYDGMDKYFPSEKIVLTGNPVRQDLLLSRNKKEEAVKYFNLDPTKQTLLILGGSLGARTINQSILKQYEPLSNSGIQVIWQTGSIYINQIEENIKNKTTSNIQIHAFISRMDLAFSVADLVISRAGAGTISELCIVAKPVILVPSPNVAEDHQTKNALALVKKEAAIMITDAEAPEKLVNQALDVLKDTDLQKKLSGNIEKLALPYSAKTIAEEVLKLRDRDQKK